MNRNRTEMHESGCTWAASASCVLFRSLAPYLADPDARVRLAVVEAVTSIGESYLHTLKVPKGAIPEENLHLIVDSELQQNASRRSF